MSKFWNDKIKSISPYIPGEQPKDKKYIKIMNFTSFKQIMYNISMWEILGNLIKDTSEYN